MSGFSALAVKGFAAYRVDSSPGIASAVRRRAAAGGGRASGIYASHMPSRLKICRFDRRRVVNFPRVTARQMERDGMIMAMQHRVTGSRR